MPPKDANRIANSEDTDQTAPGSRLFAKAYLSLSFSSVSMTYDVKVNVAVIFCYVSSHQ